MNRVENENRGMLPLFSLMNQAKKTQALILKKYQKTMELLIEHLNERARKQNELQPQLGAVSRELTARGLGLQRV